MKRIKMTYSDLYNVFWKNGHSLYAESRVTDKKGNKGTLLKIDGFTPAMKTFCGWWKNTTIVKIKSQYAPEQVKEGLIIWDKCIA